MSWRRLSPLASAELREILPTLTDVEWQELETISAEYGTTMGQYFVAPMSVAVTVVGAALFSAGVSPWVIVPAALGVVLLATVIFKQWPDGPARRFQNRQAEIYCNSARGRELGLTPETIRFWRFSFRPSPTEQNPYRRNTDDGV